MSPMNLHCLKHLSPVQGKLYKHVGVKTVYAVHEADCYKSRVLHSLGRDKNAVSHYASEKFIVNVSYL